MLPIKLFRYKIDDHIIPILASQPVITIRGDDVQRVSFNPHDCYIAGAAAQIKNEDCLSFIELVESVGGGGRGWLVKDAKDVQPGELTRRDRGGAFRIVEVSGNSDDDV